MNQSNNIKWCVHVDERGKALCEITYENQKLLLPLELTKDFANFLGKWATAIYPEPEYVPPLDEGFMHHGGAIR